MDKEGFVSHLIAEVHDRSAARHLTHHENPVGRGIDPSRHEMAAWIRDLSEEDRTRVLTLMEDAVRQAIFGTLVMLDDGDIYRDGEVAGTLALEYRDHTGTTHLNAPPGEMLHDLFNARVAAGTG